MGWICTCFGGKEALRRFQEGDGRASKRNEEKPVIEAPPPSLQILGARLESSKEACAYEEPFQPRQAVSGSPHGLKLFKRKFVRRANSYGNNTAFENGSKRLFDRNMEGRRSGRVNRLQEEVEALRKRLAEEEEEARKLRNEICYLRSCGVIQSPGGQGNRPSVERESLPPQVDSGQRNLQSWLGLTLSPRSRLKLEEHVRSMAADELSKVPGKGLTNGQKALIVATKLWHSPGDFDQDCRGQDELLNISSTSDGSWCNTSGHSGLNCGSEAASDHDTYERANSDPQLTSKHQDPAYFSSGEDNSATETVELINSPHSTASEMKSFSFLSDGKNTAQHLLLADVPVSGISPLQGISFLPDQMPNLSLRSGTEEVTPDPSTEIVTLESLNKSSFLPSVGVDSQTADYPDHSQARRFIDLRYHELEEKLLKSPTKEKAPPRSTAENSPPRLSSSGHVDAVNESDQEISLIATDVFILEAQPASESRASSITGHGASPSVPIKTQYFACKSGRLWQPLSPVRESDSGLSSERTSVSQLRVSRSTDSSLTGDLKSSIRTIISGSEWEQQEGYPHHIDDTSEGPDDDLFTLSPRRLHQSYNPWDDVSRPDEVIEEQCMPVLHVDSGSVADWVSCDEEVGLDDDFFPIQCQSPAFSPKRNLSNEKALMVEYARDRYFKDMGLNVEDFLSSTESCVFDKSSVPEEGNEDHTEILQVPNMNMNSLGVGKENNDGMEMLPVSTGQVIFAGHLKEASPMSKKALIANEMTYLQDADHPVLASIENLPKRIECQGVATMSIDNRENQHQDTLVVESDQMLPAHKDMRSERSNLSCNFIFGGNLNDNEEEKTSMHKRPEEFEFDSCLQKSKEDLPTLEFSVRQDDSVNQQSLDHEDHEEARLRLSLHGFVYPNEHGLDLSHARSTGNLVQKKGQDPHEIETENLLGEQSSPGKQDQFDGIPSQSIRGVHEAPCLAESEERQIVEPIESEHKVTLDFANSSGQQVLFCHEKNTQQAARDERMVMLDSDFKHDVLSHVQSLGYSIQIPKRRDFSLPAADTIESPCVCGDSEVSTATSRDRDDIFHDCESPTFLECDMDSAFCNYQAEAKENVIASSSGNAREEVLSRRFVDISPDDRPILGTVATHWGEYNFPKSLREWDGLGIPNSTSKFKEDQTVKWHNTPFETRLEQALSKLPVHELCKQRDLFGGNMI